ncbi:amp dependent CoA ligase [Clavulina sp. PMI_390]|nr:amp dependent CoA ligase [Clavulina sp. PMI_390]
MLFKAALPFDQRHLRPGLTLPQFFLDNTHPLQPYRSDSKPWVIDSDTGRSYGLEEIRERVFGLANAFAALYGISEIGIHSQNDIDFIVVLFAIHRLGAAAVCTNPMWTASELEHQYRQTKPVFIVTQTPFVEAARSAAAALNLRLHDRIAIIVPPNAGLPNVPSVEELVQRGLGDLNVDGPKFTERILNENEAIEKVSIYFSSSGTSGPPKLVAVSHHGMTANILQIATAHKSNDLSIPWNDRRTRDGDVASCLVPLFHVAGLLISVGYPAALSVVIHRQYAFADYLTAISKYHITHLYMVPPIAIDLIKRPETEKYDTSSIRFILMGAAPVSSTVETAMRKKFPAADIGQSYGLTETNSTVAMWPYSARHNATLGSVGQLLPGWEAKVVQNDPDSEQPADASEVLLGLDEPGELVFRGPSIALRYEGNEKATRETFLPDNWVRTGDQAYINKKGDVFIVDRLKEFMKVKGDQVAPAELEGRLLGHPDVLDACVVGVPDERSGELPFAFIALQPAARRRLQVSPNEAAKIKRSVAKWVESHEAKYKWLAGGVGFIDQIPKNASGKILVSPQFSFTNVN